MARTQAVDPAVSRVKFDREIAQYRSLEREHQRRGWWMLEAEFPEVLVVFVSPRLRPAAVIFATLLDFTDYDFRPPSVRMVDPFTREPLRVKDIPTNLKRAIPQQAGAVGPNGGRVMLATVQPLMQGLAPDDIPFLCVPGVREYHEHPAHTGDDWLLHRGGAEGTLNFILDVLYRYGVQPISGYQIEAKVTVTGFEQSGIPQ